MAEVDLCASTLAMASASTVASSSDLNSNACAGFIAASSLTAILTPSPSPRHLSDQGGHVLFRQTGSVLSGAAVVFRGKECDILAKTGKAPNNTCIYNARVVGNKFRLCKDDVPAFLADNGVPMFQPACICNLLKQHLASSMRLIDCQCSTKTLQNPVYSLRFDFDFKDYTQDTDAYEGILKTEILAAVGLPPEKLPNAKDSIEILDVTEGSVIVELCIGAGLIAAASLAAHLLAEMADDLASTAKPALRPLSQQTEQITGPTSSKRPNLRVCVPGPSPTCTEAYFVAGPISPKSKLLEVCFATDSPRSSDPHVGPGQYHCVERISFRNSSDGSWGIQGTFGLSQDCYPLHTLFETARGEFKEASNLFQGDFVLSAEGKELKVKHSVKQPRTLRTFVKLSTAQTQITVTFDHRVLAHVDGCDRDMHAGELQKGDLVRCGERLQPLTKVQSYRTNVEVMTLQFEPDDPVAVRLAPRWGISTRGAPLNVPFYNSYVPKDSLERGPSTDSDVGFPSTWEMAGRP